MPKPETCSRRLTSGIPTAVRPVHSFTYRSNGLFPRFRFGFSWEATTKAPLSEAWTSRALHYRASVIIDTCHFTAIKKQPPRHLSSTRGQVHDMCMPKA
jgi:hypothetical protein